MQALAAAVNDSCVPKWYDHLSRLNAGGKTRLLKCSIAIIDRLRLAPMICPRLCSRSFDSIVMMSNSEWTELQAQYQAAKAASSQQAV